MSAFLEAETLLAIDVGSVNTRASLFDVVDGRYRLVATGRAGSTAGGPLFDVSEGVRQALEQVQSVTGRRLVDESEALIMPASGGGAGVDVFVASASAGPRARTLLVGLMPGVSLESARRMASSCYLEVAGELGLLDHRRDEERLELIVRTRRSYPAGRRHRWRRHAVGGTHGFHCRPRAFAGGRDGATARCVRRQSTPGVGDRRAIGERG
jgi:hypothetical protein